MKLAPNKVYSDEDMEEEDDLEAELRRQREYEMSPVTRPFDVRSLLNLKQKRSELDIKAYQEIPKNLDSYKPGAIYALPSKFSEKDYDEGGPSAGKVPMKS